MRLPTSSRLRFAPTLIAALLLGLCMMQVPVLQAATLGQAAVRSTIGQTLNAEIELGSVTNAELESLTVRAAPPEAYAEANLDYSAVLRSLRFSLEKIGDRNLIRVTSDQPVNEPFLTILFEFTTSGNRIMRQYALLLDPPAIDESPTAAAAIQTAPAPAPAPDVAATPAPVESPGTAAPATVGLAAEDAARLVRRGDTLSRIAAQVRPEGARLEQVLVALQRANPQAFEGRNMNRVKSGSVLVVPSADTIKSVDAIEARRLVRAQTVEFVRYRSRIAQLAMNQTNAVLAPSANDSGNTASNNRSSSGKIGLQAVEPGAGVPAQDKLQLSAPGAATGGASDQLAAAGNASLDKIATDQALTEANSRVQALEKSLADMQQLLELKNKTLADMQAREAAMPVGPTPVAEPAAIASPEEKTLEKAAEKVAAKAPPEPLSLRAATVWLQEPWVLPAGGALAVLLLGFALLRERRRHQGHSGKEGKAQLRAAASASLLSAARDRDDVDASNSIFHSNFVPSASQLDTNEVDPVAEADVYIAYGRDEQAEEILKDALQNHPERNALRVKLLELYAGRKDAQAFGKLAADLHRLTGGMGEEWQRVVQMGQLLDPGNLLYGAMRSADVSPSARTDPNLKLASRDTTQAEPDSAMLDFDVKLENLLATRTKNGQSDVDLRSKNTDARLKNGDKPAALAGTKLSSSPADFNLGDISLELLPDAALSKLGEPGSADLTTKLDLALACQEIGDKDGARELLGEVANSSDMGLARKARSLLQQLA